MSGFRPWIKSAHHSFLERMRPPLPTSATALWHSELISTLTFASGVVSQWTDAIGGRAATQGTAANRPTYGADSNKFSGRNVVQCTSAGRCLFATGLTSMGDAGTRLQTIALGRNRTLN